MAILVSNKRKIHVGLLNPIRQQKKKENKKNDHITEHARMST